MSVTQKKEKKKKKEKKDMRGESFQCEDSLKKKKKEEGGHVTSEVGDNSSLISRESDCLIVGLERNNLEKKKKRKESETDYEVNDLKHKKRKEHKYIEDLIYEQLEGIGINKFKKKKKHKKSYGDLGDSKLHESRIDSPIKENGGEQRCKESYVEDLDENVAKEKNESRESEDSEIQNRHDYEFKVSRDSLLEAIELFNGRPEPKAKTRFGHMTHKNQTNIGNFCSLDPTIPRLVTQAFTRNESIPMQTPTHQILWAVKNAVLSHSWSTVARLLPHAVKHNLRLLPVVWRYVFLVLLNTRPNERLINDFMMLCLGIRDRAEQLNFFNRILSLDAYQENAEARRERLAERKKRSKKNSF